MTITIDHTAHIMGNHSPEAVDHSLLSKTPIRNKIQDDTLSRMRMLFYNAFPDLSAEEKLNEDNIANLKTEIEKSKTTNSTLRSRLEEANVRIESLELEKKELLGIPKPLQKWRDDESNQHEFDEENSLLENMLIWLSNEYREAVILEENNQDLRLYLERKSEEFSVQVCMDKLLKEEETEQEKKLESCKRAAKVLKDKIAKLGREKVNKDAEITRMVTEQNEWVTSIGDRIENLRGSFVEMKAAVQYNIEALMEKFYLVDLKLKRTLKC